MKSYNLRYQEETHIKRARETAIIHLRNYIFHQDLYENESNLKSSLGFNKSKAYKVHQIKITALVKIVKQMSLTRTNV